MNLKKRQFQTCTAYVNYFHLVITGFAQDDMPTLPTDSDKRIVYTNVVSVDSLATKNELFSRGREWFAKAYNSSTDVIQMEDRESGKIVGKALFVVYHKAFGMTVESGHIDYTISLYFKSGRYKYEVTNFVHTSNYESGRIKTSCNEMPGESRKLYKKVYSQYLVQLDLNIKTLIADLKKAMLAESPGESDDDG